MSDETKAKIGAANAIHMLGRKLSDATREKQRQSQLKRFSTPDARKRLSEALEGHACSDATREKMRIAMTGRIIRPETREKLRRFNLGRKQSPEHIANRMLGMKLVRERKAGIVE